MSNWKPHADLSKPNWTGRPQHTSTCYQRQKDEPSWFVQAAGAVLGVAFIVGLCWVI